MARLRYRLIKETHELRKGAIVEEKCDDGDQEFQVLDKKYEKHPGDWGTITVGRMAVIREPEWWERVVMIEISESKVKRVEQFIKTLK